MVILWSRACCSNGDDTESMPLVGQSEDLLMEGMCNERERNEWWMTAYFLSEPEISGYHWGSKDLSG